MNGHANARQRAFAERLARIRGAYPEWEIRATPPRQVGWTARRGDERIWAATLTELEGLLAGQPGRAP